MDPKVIGPALENNLSVLIKKRRYSAALHNVAVIHAPVVAKPAAFRTNFPAPAAKTKAAPEFSHSGAAGVIAPKLLWPWRWRFFWLSRLPAFWLSLCLAVIGRGRRATGLPLLRLLVLLWRRRLTISALHSFSLAARFTRGSATRRRRHRLTESRRPTSTTLLTFTCASRRRRAEPLTLVGTLRRRLPCSTLAGAWFLA